MTGQLKSTVGTDILLVSMPFGPLFQPSIGLSSLRGTVAPLGVSVHILYLTLRFAKMIGTSVYNRIGNGEPYVDFAGDWLFTTALYTPDEYPHSRDDFVNAVLRRQSPANRYKKAAPEDYIESLLQVQTKVEDFIQHSLTMVVAYRPKIVGFTSMFQQNIASLALARRIKAHDPDIFIVFGGPNCEGAMGAELVRQFPFVDAAVSGEGEIIFPLLVEAVLNGDSVEALQGVYTRRNVDFLTVNGGKYPNAPSVYAMDELPIPTYDDFFVQLDGANLNRYQETRILFETSRGCWWGERNHCTFCGLNGSTMAYRSKSAERALSELVQLTSAYPQLPVWVVDNILDMKYLNTFLPQVKTLNLDAELFYEIKANMRKEQLRLMRDAGIKTIQPGIESLSDHVLELMKKGVSGIHNLQLLKWSQALGIKVYWNILWGFPGETAADYDDMADMVPYITHLEPPFSTGMIRLDRFSPNYDFAQQLGFRQVEPIIAYHYLYPFDDTALANLAYHFKFEYQDARTVSDYTKRLNQAVKQWKALHNKSALFMADIPTEGGNVLLIGDFRPYVGKGFSVLSGLERALYLACDEGRLPRHLKPMVEPHLGREVAQEDIPPLMERLVAKRLVWQSGLAYLSLGVPLGDYSPPVAVLERIYDMLDDFDEDECPTEDTRFVGIDESAHTLTADYFRVNAAGEVAIYQAGLWRLIKYHYKREEIIPHETIGGITLDIY